MVFFAILANSTDRLHTLWSLRWGNFFIIQSYAEINATRADHQVIHVSLTSISLIVSRFCIYNLTDITMIRLWYSSEFSERHSIRIYYIYRNIVSIISGCVTPNATSFTFRYHIGMLICCVNFLAFLSVQLTVHYTDQHNPTKNVLVKVLTLLQRKLQRMGTIIQTY